MLALLTNIINKVQILRMCDITLEIEEDRVSKVITNIPRPVLEASTSLMTSSAILINLYLIHSHFSFLSIRWLFFGSTAQEKRIDIPIAPRYDITGSELIRECTVTPENRIDCDRKSESTDGILAPPKLSNSSCMPLRHSLFDQPGYATITCQMCSRHQDG
jgi:hypothetical protein